MITRYSPNWETSYVNPYEKGDLCNFREAQEAVQKFLQASGHDLCHENRRELAEAFGLQDVVPKPPTSREEFRARCIQYEMQLYGPSFLSNKETARKYNYLLKYPEVTDEERKELIGIMTDGICRECGRVDDHCQCWNDE